MACFNGEERECQFVTQGEDGVFVLVTCGYSEEDAKDVVLLLNQEVDDGGLKVISWDEDFSC